MPPTTPPEYRLENRDQRKERRAKDEERRAKSERQRATTGPQDDGTTRQRNGPRKSSFRRAAETNTPAACAPQSAADTAATTEFAVEAADFTVEYLKRVLPVIIFVFVFLIAGLAVYIDWTWKRQLSPRGGRYFFHRLELAVPVFKQSDEKWRDDPLGGVPENGTLGGEGCAVAAAAMVFRFYGIDTDPQQLNWFLASAGGYTERGWIYWDRAAWFAPNRVRHIYEDLASYQLIDSNLARGNPVIVRVRLSNGVTHFVVIAGKDGFDYLVRDPGAGAARGLYPLRELGSNIEALRFYEPVTTFHHI